MPCCYRHTGGLSPIYDTSFTMRPAGQTSLDEAGNEADRDDEDYDHEVRSDSDRSPFGTPIWDPHLGPRLGPFPLPKIILPLLVLVLPPTTPCAMPPPHAPCAMLMLHLAPISCRYWLHACWLHAC